jgi:MSHA pilin protein MshC
MKRCAKDSLQGGFTLTELVLVIVIAGILSAIIYNRIDITPLKTEGSTDEVRSTVRYAHKLAVAQRKNVCVSVVAGSISLRYFDSSTGACSTAVSKPPGTAAFTTSTLNGATLSEFFFDPLGRPTLTSTCVLVSGTYVCTPAAAVITLTVTGGTRSIKIEAETGFVHY